MITITFDATWWVVLVFIVDIVIRVAAIIIVPRNRRPTAAMAWLLAIFFIPIVGVSPVPAHRQPAAAAQAPPQAGAHQRLHPRHRGRRSTSARCAARAAVVHVDRHTQPQPRRHAARRATTPPHLCPDYQESLDAMADAIRRRSASCTSSSTSSRRMPLPKPSSARSRTPRSARVTVRVLLDHWATSQPGLPAHAQAARRHGREWHLMLPVQPLPRQVPAPRPAQPPQAARHRRRGRVHGLAERHRLHVQPAQEHQARPALEGL